MKILIIRNFPSYMSVTNNTYNIQELGLAKALTRKGHQCDIVFWTDKDEEDFVVPVDSDRIINIYYRKGITKLKNTVFNGCDVLFEQYDVLQPCEYNQIQSWMLAKRYPTKTVIYHGPYYSAFNKRYNLMCKVFDLFFVKRYIKLGTKFIVKSNMAKQFLVSKGINVSNIKLAGVGIDLEMLSAPDNECNDLVYKRIHEDESNLKFLYIGRLEERRNINFLFEVFAKVYEKYPTAKLYVIGKGTEEYVSDVFQYAEELKIRDAIVYQERMEQKYLADVYTNSDFFLLPTEYEIFGMVLLEAMYYKNVVVTTVNGGSSTLIANGIHGIVHDELNADVWSKTICELCDDHSKKEEMKMHAHQIISQSFTWDSLVDCFIEHYSK